MFSFSRAASPIDFSRLDRWYLRAQAELIGDYQLFRVRLRAVGSSPT
jgi:hypothetical protein